MEAAEGGVAKACADERAKENFPEEQRRLLALELETIDASWQRILQPEFTKHYFLQLKRFVLEEQTRHTVFPPAEDIYQWTRLTPFSKVRVVIIGQDPYHNHNQAHGLAFSVRAPTPAPPSLRNIYKELQINYTDFVADNALGDLTRWATQGVLLLNTSLTVRAHCANSHSKKGWEPFTSRVVQLLVEDRRRTGQPLVFLLWGAHAAKLVDRVLGGRVPDNFLVLRSVHPSPLSASRGFFGNFHFRKINDWLMARGQRMIDWSVVPDTELKEVRDANKETGAASST
ncbi:AER327Cp [Eremothecium gossypii ATCC 10895]|uniref:Uracil-DNA glycosylase n=1 Tax=Eremothecium gossypii (strain ATCC 10895 / CBS 109.51 / FGSC 9923 / NRRL Y-1056) TaxID=284811 RepID=Q756E0_EREGS|nr:AER327Cp [Eremothecium gossypii ATCC 10895]AAS53007.1 AER327Cp [Eremothecium gossypii ATCC 10895]AEY97315.1 FAER327Cp [Eremothecium gossypii FDAG1]